MKKIIVVLAIVLAYVALAGWQPHDARGAPAVAKPQVFDARPEGAAIPSWGLGPFVRDEGADFIMTDAHSVFPCPARKSIVHWEDQAILCAAAVVKDNKVYILYRAE